MNTYLMKNMISVMMLTFLLVVTSCTKDEAIQQVEHYIPSSLDNSTWEMYESPEAAGWSTFGLLEAYNYATTKIQTAAVMVIYKGKVLYHWGDIERKYMAHSCRKSFMSAIIGMAVTDGEIDLDKTIADLGIDDENPTLNDTEKNATVKMLLQARSGVYHEAAYEAPEMKANRPERNSHLPGTFWYYNNWDFNTLLTIYEQETERKYFEDLYSKIAVPIGMEDFQVSDGEYFYERYSIHPAYPIRMSARDFARFGQLFLQNGMWNDERVISEEWINESTRSYSVVSDYGGYGYMWWTIDSDDAFVPSGSYYASGYNGHYILIIPKEEIVIVHRVNTDIGNKVTGQEYGYLIQMILNAKNN